MMKDPRYVIAVPDLEVSATFYRDVLGFEVHDIGDPGWRFYFRDAVVIMAGECPDALPPRELGDHSWFAYIEVDGIDELHAAIAGKGADVLSPPADEPWGMREFGVRTVDGHRIRFGSPIRDRVDAGARLPLSISAGPVRRMDEQHPIDRNEGGTAMRRLIMWNLMTLDGCFEGPRPWNLDFHERAWGEELRRFSLEQADEVGGLLFGRVTYEGMAAHWSAATDEIADFMNAIPKYVFSRTLESADWNNTTLVQGDTAETVARLKEQPGKDLFVFGSADLSANLIRQGLFDEYRIGLVPVTLGAGEPLFKPDAKPLELELLQSRPLGDRCLLLRYRPAGVAAAAH